MKTSHEQFGTEIDENFGSDVRDAIGLKNPTNPMDLHAISNPLNFFMHNHGDFKKVFEEFTKQAKSPEHIESRSGIIEADGDKISFDYEAINKNPELAYYLGEFATACKEAVETGLNKTTVISDLINGNPLPGIAGDESHKYDRATVVDMHEAIGNELGYVLAKACDCKSLDDVRVALNNGDPKMTKLCDSFFEDLGDLYKNGEKAAQIMENGLVMNGEVQFEQQTAVDMFDLDNADICDFAGHSAGSKADELSDADKKSMDEFYSNLEASAIGPETNDDLEME